MLELIRVANVFSTYEDDRKHSETTFYPIPYVEHEQTSTYGLKILGGIYSAASRLETARSLEQLDKVNLHKGFVIGDITPTEDNVYSVLNKVLSIRNNSLSLINDKMLFAHSSGIYAHHQRIGLLMDMKSSTNAMQLRSTGSIALQPFFRQSPGHWKYLKKTTLSGEIIVQGSLLFRKQFPIHFESSLNNSLPITMALKNVPLLNNTESMVISNDHNLGNIFVIQNKNKQVNFKINPSEKKVHIRGNVYVKNRLKKNGQYVVPTGTILMYCGSALPSGWAICNGTVVNGYKTPNLVNRFLRGRATTSIHPNLGGGETHHHFHKPLAFTHPIPHKHGTGNFGKIDLKTSMVRNMGKATVHNNTHFSIPIPQDWKLGTSLGIPKESYVFNQVLYSSKRTVSGKSPNKYDWAGSGRLYGFLVDTSSSLRFATLDHDHHVNNRNVRVNIPIDQMEIENTPANFQGAITDEQYWDIPRVDVVFIVKLPGN